MLTVEVAGVDRVDVGVVGTVGVRLGVVRGADDVLGCSRGVVVVPSVGAVVGPDEGASVVGPVVRGTEVLGVGVAEVEAGTAVRS